MTLNRLYQQGPTNNSMLLVEPATVHVTAWLLTVSLPIRQIQVSRTAVGCEYRQYEK